MVTNSSQFGRDFLGFSTKSTSSNLASTNSISSRQAGMVGNQITNSALNVSIPPSKCPLSLYPFVHLFASLLVLPMFCYVSLSLLTVLSTAALNSLCFSTAQCKTISSNTASPAYNSSMSPNAPRMIVESTMPCKIQSLTSLPVSSNTDLSTPLNRGFLSP